MSTKEEAIKLMEERIGASSGDRHLTTTQFKVTPTFMLPKIEGKKKELQFSKLVDCLVPCTREIKFGST